jgi:hypothetical protein
MKGHVGGGPVTDSLWVSNGSVKFMPFLNVTSVGLAGGTSKCPNTQTHQFVIFVQERLPEMPACSRLFRRGLVVHQLESLILAQNERWRHA